MKQVVYTASPESQQIHAWRLEEDGALSLLQVTDVSGQVQPMVLSPDQNVLYVGVRPDFRVLAFRIAADGTLSEAGQAPLPGSPTHISLDRDGRFLFCGSYNDACVSISPIDEQGLPQAPTQVIGGLDGCHSANIDRANQRLFVPALKQDRICLFDLSAEGALTSAAQPQVEVEKGAGPRHMAFHPGGQYAYSVNELNSSVDVWALNGAQGNVERVQSLDIMPPDFSGTRWAADIHLTPNGRFLYACDRTSSTLTLLQVSEDGSQLKVAGYQPTETQPRGFNIDSRGRYLVAAGQKSHHIEVYRIDEEQGALTPLARYAVGQGPMWVVIRAAE